MGAFPSGHGCKEKRKVGQGREVCEEKGRRVMVAWWSPVTARGGEETGRRNEASGGGQRWVKVGKSMEGTDRGGEGEEEGRGLAAGRRECQAAVVDGGRRVEQVRWEEEI